MGTMLRIAILTIAMVCLTVVGHATTIEYTATQISGPQWQYTYTVTGSFADGDFLSIDFDANTFADLQDPPPQVTDWDAIVFQADSALGSNGAFSAMALKGNPSLPVTFTVLFNFLGMGTPGSQAFSIYNFDGDELESGTTILAGQTAPVPEPGTLLLLLSGAGALTRKFRKSA